MELIKKLVILMIIVLLLGGFLYGALLVRNTMTAKDYTDYWQEQLFNGGNFTYVILGDSYALGIGATTVRNGYPGRIAAKIKDSGRSVRMVNLSSKDATLDDVISNQIPKVANYKPDLVTVTVGMQDINNNENVDDISQKYSYLIQALPTHVSYIGELPASYDKNKNATVVAINAQINSIGAQNGINVVPLYAATYPKRFDITTYDWDLTHPSDKGYQLWADTFWTSIQ